MTILNGDLSPAPSGTAAARIENLEYTLQSVLFERIKIMAALYPEYKLAFAVPNDMVRPGQRSTPGIKAGVPDIFWAVARGGYHGMFIELKVGRNKPSPDQERWIKNLQSEGYYCVIGRNDAESVLGAMEYYRCMSV